MPRRKDYDEDLEDEGVEGEEEEEDEDFDAEDEDEDQDYRSKKKSASKKPTSTKKRKKRSDFIDDAAESDDEEDEDDEARNSKRKKSKFIDDAADVADDDEEDFDEEAEVLGDLIDDEEGDGGPAPSYIPRDRHFHDEDVDEELLRERLENLERRAQQADEIDEGGATAQQGLLPTLQDPRLWVLECRPGSEREAVIQLLQKSYAKAADGNPLQIKSAVCLDHLKGYIYVEADKEVHVRDAASGLHSIFMGKGVKLVPLNEMVDSITPNKKAASSFAVDGFVRVKGGLYKDDLARVTAVDLASARLTIILIPRIDFKKIVEAQTDETKRVPFGRRGPVRPPARAYNHDEAMRQGCFSERRRIDGKYYYYMNSHQFTHDGYIIRNVAFKSVVPVDVMPDVEELTRFNAPAAAARRAEDGGGDSMATLLASLPADGHAGRFGKGDKVEVVSGDLLHMVGEVLEVQVGGKLLVLPEMQELSDEPLEFDADQLRKFYQVGDAVKIVAGRHSGENGMIVRVQDGVCTVLSDSTKEQLTVFSRDLTAASAGSAVTSTSVLTLGPYQLYDLVQLSNNSQGVIVKIEKDAARVLTTGGTPTAPEIRLVKQADITRKLFSRNASTQDINGNPISVGEPATVRIGPAKGKKGIVEYVARQFVFVKIRGQLDHGGFLCVSGNSCQGRLAGPPPSASGGYGGGGGGSDVMRTPSRYAPQSPAPHMAAPRSPAPHQAGPPRGGSNPYGGRVPLPPPPQGGAFSGRTSFGPMSSRLVDKRVQVTGGTGYKGYKGTVKHETPTHVRIELDALNKTITVSKSHIKLQDAPQAPGPRPAPDSRRPPDSRYTPSTPSYNNPHRTPLHPSATPMHTWGGATPLHPSMTPHHVPAMTPLHPSVSTPDEPWNAGTPRDDYAPAPTPGSMHAPTPGYTPVGYSDAYNPLSPGAPAATPGLEGFTPQDAYTPMDGYTPSPNIAGTPGPAPTPGLPATTPYEPAPTPATSPDAVARTPGAYEYAYTATPGQPAPTPAALTPGMGYTPGQEVAQTPGGGLLSPDMGSDSEVWVGVLVQLPEGGEGVVRSVGLDGHCMVQPGRWDSPKFAPEGEETVVEVADLKPVVPKRGDRVRVLAGSTRGQVGHCTMVDRSASAVFAKVGQDMALTVKELPEIGVLVE